MLVAGDDKKETNAKHGLYRVLVNNMVKGVTEGFKKTIIVNGVGYKVQKQGNKVVMNIGFSHPVEIVEENGITLESSIDGWSQEQMKATTVVVKGISKEAVGQYAAMVRGIKPVEPYHAYGLRYDDEVVVRKVGKVSGKK